MNGSSVTKHAENQSYLNRHFTCVCSAGASINSDSSSGYMVGETVSARSYQFSGIPGNEVHDFHCNSLPVTGKDDSIVCIKCLLRLACAFCFHIPLVGWFKPFFIVAILMHVLM